jgi:hypothetical protein
MAAGDLTTVDAVRDFLKAQVPVPTTDETLVQGLVSAVSKAFAEESGCPVLTTEYVETRDGNDGTKLFLQNYPVVAITSVKVGGETIPSRASVTESGWVVSNATGLLALIGYEFERGTANVEVTYSAGYGDAAPADVAQAVVDQVAYLYRAKDRIGVTNEATSSGGSVTYLGGWQQQQGQGGKTPLYMATVARYRRVA